jgi:hypothetical protein
MLTRLNIRTAADARALLYTLLPVVSTLLISFGALDKEQAALWAGLVTAVAGPALAAYQARTLSSFRTAFYAVGLAVQALVVGYGIVTDDQVGVWTPVVAAVVGLLTGGVAAANTDTSGYVGEHRAG